MTEDTGHHDHPHNELETHLYEMWDGKMTKEDFLRIWLLSDLFIIVDGEPVGNTLGDRKPMVISTAVDQPKMIAVFSSPERAARMIAQFPDYNFPIRVDTNWVLHCIGPTMGVAFNPGWELGFEIGPEGVQQLKHALDNAMTQAGEV
jgi:hypothetical protein